MLKTGNMDASDEFLLNLTAKILENQHEHPLETLPEIYLPECSNKLPDFPLLDPAEVPYEDFFEKYIVKNRPCLFTESLIADWNVMDHWVVSKHGQDVGIKKEINFEGLLERYGNVTVSVTNCNEALADYGNPDCQSMTIFDYVSYWKKYRDSGYPSSIPCLYLKDWHLLKNITGSTGITESNQPDDRSTHHPYKSPIYFASDWLNESSTSTNDDFRFAYMGPKGSWTPFHADVYGSFSWSANVIGTKKWLIYPPGKENIFKDSKGKLNYNYDDPGRKDIDFYEVIQEAGQTIFVPSGWHHAVWNLEDTISINHNWINGANIGYIWANLKSALKDVIHELDDLKDSEDFTELCQQLLLANHGMNYISLVDLLNSILKNRKQNFQYIPNYSFDSYHVQFDVKAISGLMHLLKLEPEFDILRKNSLFQAKLEEMQLKS